MSRAGRKRKAAERHACGKLKQPKAPDLRALAANQPHRRGLVFNVKGERVDQRLSDHASTVLGQLFLSGTLTRDQLFAGERYAEQARAYLQSVDCPPTHPPSIAGAFEPRRGARDISAAEEIEIRNRYMRAFEAAATAGRLAQLQVKSVAVHDQPCPVWQIKTLKKGLDALCAHYGLTTNRKSASFRNTN